MTNNKRTIAILSITSILIFSGFGYSPFAYSTGSWSGHDKDDRDRDWDDWKDWKKWKENKKHKDNNIESGLCNSPDNLIENGCFESPDVDTEPDWDIYPESEALPYWEATWVNPNACEGQYADLPGQLELQEGILGGPAEGTQHAELDSDCNGPNGPSDGEELTSVIISQETMESTSGEDEYVITFAYKARPGKNLPLSTNGLTVEWNGDDVTPDLKFSKKKWKYATVTVNGLDVESGGPGPSELKFTDTGTSDTLGTFLDDISVIKVPKPVVTIILTKEIDNSADPDNSLVFNSPDDFDITLYVAPLEEEPPTVGSPVPGTQIGEDNPNVLQNGGLFRISEDAPNYIATIEGSGCPEVSTDPSTFSVETEPAELEPGDTLTCHIKNTFVPPPELTLKKALTNDNGGNAKASDFTVDIWDEHGPNGPDGMPDTGDEPNNSLKTVHFDKDTSSVIVPLSPGKYVMTESIVPAGDDGDPSTTGDNPEASTLGDYTTVLIAGDTLCPSMENEVFELTIGNNITCTIYNDDNFNPAESGGLTFGLTSLDFKVGMSTNPVDPTSAATAGINSCHIPEATLPCVANLNESFDDPPAGADKDQWLIVDNEVTETSIFVFTLIPPFDPDALVPEIIDEEEQINLQVHTCITAGVVYSPVLQPDPEDPTLKAFRLSCVTLNPGDWTINYGFIETNTMLG